MSTGVGSTGWLRSIYTGAIAIAHELNPDLPPISEPSPIAWDSDRLMFNAREPWPSLTTGAGLVSGGIRAGQSLKLVSRMPEGGVIFGDGIQADYLEFNAGVTAQIGVAATHLRLVIR